MEPTEFGQYLKALREAKKITMRELDKRSGVSHSYISKMESGAKGIPSADILKKLHGPLGVSLTELMTKAGHISEGEINQSISSSNFLDEMIRDYVQLLLSDRDHPFFNEIESEFTSRIGDIYKEYDVNSNSRIIKVEDSRIRDDIPEQYSDLLIRVENTEFKWDVIKELRHIAHEFHLEYNPIYKQTFLPVDELTYYLDRPGIRYNGRKLMPSDRQRILEMLKLMFPESD